MKRIDTEWIQSISVFKDGKATVMYGGSGKNGVIIIALKEDHIDDFLEGRKPDNTLIIRKVD
jgi:TonB-dependent SusC/RagA subfamily outer membrane receptor